MNDVNKIIKLLESAMSLLVMKQPDYMVAHHVRDAIKLLKNMEMKSE